MHRIIIKKLLTLKLIEMKNFYYYLIGFALLTVLGIYSCSREKLIDYADYKSSEVIEKGFSKISINFITGFSDDKIQISGKAKQTMATNYSNYYYGVIVLDAKTKLKKINNLERGRLSILKQNNDYSIKYKDNLQIVSLRIPYSSDNFIVETDKL